MLTLFCLFDLEKELSLPFLYLTLDIPASPLFKVENFVELTYWTYYIFWQGKMVDVDMFARVILRARVMIKEILELWFRISLLVRKSDDLLPWIVVSVLIYNFLTSFDCLLVLPKELCRWSGSE